MWACNNATLLYYRQMLPAAGPSTSPVPRGERHTTVLRSARGPRSLDIQSLNIYYWSYQLISAYGKGYILRKKYFWLLFSCSCFISAHFNISSSPYNFTEKINMTKLQKYHDFRLRTSRRTSPCVAFPPIYRHLYIYKTLLLSLFVFCSH